MNEVVGIKIDNESNIIYIKPSKYKFKKGVTIIVSTERGLEYATVTQPNNKINFKNLDNNYKIMRIANKKDYYRYKKNNIDSQKAFIKCRELIKRKNMNMKLLDARYTFDRNQLLFRFISDERVDFRNLARDLANIFKTRIELRQIGIRDKSKEVGGCGQCGRELCCKRFLKDFDSVSINMAKNQGIALNPTKINGVCGRLLCCLKYEDSTYKEYQKNLPKVGKYVETEKGKGKVIGVDVLKQTYRVSIDDYGILECDINESD